MIIRNILKQWLPLAAAIILLSGMIYIIVQQNLRLGANEPQIQMAEDAARELANGASPETVVPAGKVDIGQSLAPFVAVFDRSGKALVWNGELNGAAPVLPAGVFSSADEEGENRVTWQPAPGVRIAAVVVPTGKNAAAYILAGRSLREAENRIDLLTLQVAAGVLGTLFVTLVLVVLLEILPGFRERQKS